MAACGFLWLLLQGKLQPHVWLKSGGGGAQIFVPRDFKTASSVSLIDSNSELTRGGGLWSMMITNTLLAAITAILSAVVLNSLWHEKKEGAIRFTVTAPGKNDLRDVDGPKEEVCLCIEPECFFLHES